MTLFGYDFRDEALAQRALTTPSYRIDFPAAQDNQRLEFLGDAVLGLLSAERLYADCPDEREGRLSSRRALIVSTAALCRAAKRLELAHRLRRNHACQPLPEDSKTLADAVEAILGAAYLDGGLDAARTVFNALELEDVAEAAGEWSGNPKGELQVRAQAMTPPRHPVYTLLDVVGEAHCPRFTAKVEVEGWGSAQAEASTRRSAEAAAAAALLESLPK